MKQLRGLMPSQIGFMPISLGALYVALAGLLAFRSVNLVGVLYLGELVALAGMVYVIGSLPRLLRIQTFRNMLLFLMLMFVGYLLSDIFSGNSQHNILRGWARIGFLTTDFLFLSAVFVASPRLALWYVTFMGIGRIYSGAANDNFLAAWKMVLGNGLGFLLAGLSCLLPRRLSAGVMFSFGMFSLLLGARSLGGTALFSSVLSFIKSKGGSVSVAAMARAVFAVVLAFVFVVVIYVQFQEEILSSRKDSMAGRAWGVVEAMKSVARSPIIGRGSWNFFHAGQAEGISMLARPDDIALGGHSYVLQSWVEGGFLAGLFFLYMLAASGSGLLAVVGRRPHDALTTVYIYVFIWNVWNTLFSPFGGDHRIWISTTMALLVLLNSEEGLAPAALSREHAGLPEQPALWRS